MGLVETEAIILRTYKLAEADKIVICLTRKAGVVRGVARGARRLKSRFGASLEPFTHVNLTYYEKEGRELVSISQAEITRSFFNLAGVTEALAALEYLGQLAIEFVPPNQPDERLYRMVRACVEALAETPDGLATVVLYYELWMLKLSGFLPDLRTCGVCRRKLEEGREAVYVNFEGVLRCAACRAQTDQSLDPGVYAQMRSMRTRGPAEWAAACATLSSKGRESLAQLTRRLIGRALEREPRVKISDALGARERPHASS